MDDPMSLVLFFLFLPVLKRVLRRDDARCADERARDALNEWIRTHPGMSLAQPQGRRLIEERIRARKAYEKACPAIEDGGVLVRYLEACRDDGCEVPAEYPMP